MATGVPGTLAALEAAADEDSPSVEPGGGWWLFGGEVAVGSLVGGAVAIGSTAASRVLLPNLLLRRVVEPVDIALLSDAFSSAAAKAISSISSRLERSSSFSPSSL